MTTQNSDTQNTVNEAPDNGVGTGELVSVAWQTGTPDVKDGGSETFWCAFCGDNGKIYHKFLCYQNGYIMPLADSCEDAPANAVPVGDDGDYAWTGWSEKSCDQCDTQWSFNQTVIAWMRLPRFDANNRNLTADEK